MTNDSHNYWNELFRRPEYAYGTMPNEYLKDKLKGLPPGKILFAAEGEGRNALHAATLGWTVSAFDQSSAGKAKAEALALKNKVQIDYSVYTVETMDYTPTSFNVLALIYAHFDTPVRMLYHQELSALLKTGGHLILEAFSKNHTVFQMQNPKAGGPKDLDFLYDLTSLKEDFQGFRFIEAMEVTAQLDEGLYHQGDSRVVRIFATKK